MTQQQWERVKEVLGAVDGLRGGELESALDRLCAGNADLRREVDSLLEQESRIGIFEHTQPWRPPIAGAPEQIGPYRVERLLGAGGMGAVYLASRADDQYRKQVAIKVIQQVDGVGLEQRFRTERQILATLEHPSIARLLDGGALPDGRPYLVMEYVDGVPIDCYVEECKLPLRDTLRLFLQVCAAVQFAHQNLIVHRDLKPGNILVTASGDPRLLDFGIAKVLAENPGDMESTRPLERILTPAAASPEQVSGGPVTTGSDVYSLGVLLYRLLTGVSPYAGVRSYPADIAGAILHYEPPAASTVARHDARALRGDIDTTLRKALEKDPARRYRTVDEFAADIQRYLDGRPVAARPAGYLYRAGKFVRRNRVAVAAGAVLVFAIGSGIAGTLWYARRAQAEKARADRRFEALRQLSESLLFEFNDSIQNLPGSTQARALVVRRALEYLDQLAADNSTDQTVQRDLASGYVRIGQILAGERGPHLGGPESVEQAFSSFEKALAIRRRLAAAHPSDAALQRDLLEALWTVASTSQLHGQEDRALALQRERLQLTERFLATHKNIDIQYSLGTTYASLGDLYRSRGDLDQALTYTRRSLAVRQALLDADPQSARAQRVVGLSHEFIAYVLADRQNYTEAAREHSRALAEFAPLLVSDPRNTDLQRNVHVAEANLCETLVRSGSAEAAIGHCRHAVDLAEAMVRADAGNVQASEDLASAYATMGFALHQAKQLSSALDWERRADKQFGAALVRDPESQETAARYSDALVELARIETDLHVATVCDHVLQAKRLLKKLEALAPADKTIQTRLSDAGKVGTCR